MAERGISLTRYAQSRAYLPNRKEAFRLRIQAHHAVLMFEEIFLYRKSVVDPDAGTEMDEFMTVCSPFDLLAYPANTPNTSQDPPFFRKSLAECIVPGQAEANEAWLDIYEEVCTLVESLNKLDYLGEVETVRCGGEAEPDISLSESLSASASEAL